MVEEVDGQVSVSPWRVALAALLVAAGVGAAAPACIAAPAAGFVKIELRETLAVLRHESHKDRNLGLPRLLLFDARGRLVLFEEGYSDGVDERMRKSLAKDQPISKLITLSVAMSELEGAQHKPVQTLPRADAYIAEYSADWCEPCHLLARNIELFLPRWKGEHVVWLKIDVDPTKVR